MGEDWKNEREGWVKEEEKEGLGWDGRETRFERRVGGGGRDGRVGKEKDEEREEEGLGG